MVKKLLILFAVLLCLSGVAIAAQELDADSDGLIDAGLVDAYTKDAMDTTLEGVQPDISEYTQEVAEAGTSQTEGVMTPLRARQLTAAYLKDIYGYGTPLAAEPDEYVGMVVLAEGYTASWDPADQHADGYDGAYWAVCTATGTPGTWKATLRIDGTMPYTGTQYKTWVFDPAAVCAGAFDGLALITANGATSVEKWKITFIDADPTTELDIDLKRADSHPGRANSAVMDVLDTTSGTATEATEANINSDAAVATGKVIYLQFGTAYTETGHQVQFELWFRNE